MTDADARCPFLVPVMADRLWMYPMPAYCRRPDARVKVPAAETFLRVCTSSGYLRCPGFLASTERERVPGA
jgi:hypothetical protein